MFKIAYYSATGSELLNLSRAVKKINDLQGEIIEVRAYDKRDLNDLLLKDEFIRFINNADFLFIYLMGGKDSCPGFEEIINAIPEDLQLYIQDNSAVGAQLSLKYSTVSNEVRKKISLYYRYGGEKNLYNMLLFMINQFSDRKVEFNDPLSLPWEGIYHPDFKEIPDLASYFQEKINPALPTVGLWFYRGHWINNNIDYIDTLIKEIEAQGANPLAVFFNSRQDDDLGNLGAAKVIDKFFFRDGKPIIDILINLMMFSIDMNRTEEASILEKIGVPVIKGIVSTNDRRKWEESFQGLNPIDITISIAMPEVDGNIIALPVAFKDEARIDSVTGTKISLAEPHRERIERFVSLVLNWVKLRHTANKNKKVAIIFHNYPPRNDNIGSAFGLDSSASVWNILKGLKDQGYKLDYLPEDSQAMMNEVIGGLTNERNWSSVEEMARKANGKVPLEQYKKWFNNLPDKVKKEMVQFWGNPPGDLFYYQNHLLIPGVINGNIFIGIQPPRGFLEDIASVYHSPDLPIPHHYYAYYEWIRNVFGAQAVIHIGKHGSLEWLPGKSAGLSDCCYPDLAIADLPNIYPYIINNPGEGTQAKRRSYCCIIDHLIPVMHNADLYDEMAELETLLEDYYHSKTVNKGKIPVLTKLIWDKVLEAELDHDLQLNREVLPVDFDLFLGKLHTYLSEIKDTQIRDGLHIFGEAPEGKALIEFLVSLTRLANGDIPSLREVIAQAKGYNLDFLLANRGLFNNDKRTNGQIIDEIQQLSIKLITILADKNFASDSIGVICQEIIGTENNQLEKVLKYMTRILVPNIKKTNDELNHVVAALEGKFIPPGPSGAPTRGMAHILPTGRNFYSVNPLAIPSSAAWEVGKDLANNLLNRYFKEKGEYPENIGIVLWGSPTMRTKGDDVAEALYLMGVKPIRKTGGYIKGLELIPLKELKRPRIDVTFRVSGFLRDAFPNIVELLDQAVKMVAFLDESFSQNYLAKHVAEDLKKFVDQGSDLEKARRDSSYRVFSCKPGTYGAGVSTLIESKQWENDRDLAEVYVVWGGYAYGADSYGEKRNELFKQQLAKLDVAVKNVDTREYDMLDSDDFYSYHGGMVAAVRAFKGKAPMAYVGDSSDPQRVITRTTSEETRHIFRSRILNPKWIESMKRHGYKGAADISRAVDIAFGWDATAETMDDWMYDKLTERFVLDREFTDWLKDVNPWALQNITERLLEAIKRGMWNVSEEMEGKLKQTYLEIEGELEGFNEVKDWSYSRN